MDLLDAATVRGLARGHVQGGGGSEGGTQEDAFARSKLGKLVINEEPGEGARGSKQRSGQGRRKSALDELGSPKRKRKRVHEMDVDSDDSDFDDLRGIAGLHQAYRRTENAASLRQAGSYAHSQQTSQTRKGRGKATGTPAGGSNAHKAAGGAGRFKAKKADGDVKGGSKMEPFAYWSLDKKLLNRRGHKQKAAKSDLSSVVASEAPARGKKAKKRRL